MFRNASKTEDREATIAIVWLNNVANVEKSTFVLVIATHVMERVLLLWVSIRSSVIDGCDKGNSPASAQVVNETWSHVNFKASNLEVASAILEIRI